MRAGRERLGLAATALLLAACSPGAQPAADTSEPESASAETVTVPAAGLWPAEYAAMRSAAAGWAADEVEAEAQAAARYTGPPVETFDIFSCTEPDAEPGEIDPRTARLSALAHQSVLLEARLKAAGYSEDLWSDALADYQREALKLLEGEVPAWGTPAHDALEEALAGHFQKVAATLELRRQTLQPEQLQIINEGGCGAFETPFLVRADPPGGRIWLTTRFTFQTCQALGKSAWDTAQCRWTEVQPDRPSFLSGTYMVQARWPDGRTVRSSQRFQPDPNLGDEESVPITIRPG